MTARPEQETLVVGDPLVLICEILNTTRTDLPLVFCFDQTAFVVGEDVSKIVWLTYPQEITLGGERIWRKTDHEPLVLDNDNYGDEFNLTVPARQSLRIVLDAQKATSTGEHEWMVKASLGKCAPWGGSWPKFGHVVSNPVKFIVLP